MAIEGVADHKDDQDDNEIDNDENEDDDDLVVDFD